MNWWIVMRVLILDAHTIYRRGVVVSLQNAEDVDGVSEAATVGEARTLLGADAVDIVLVDQNVEGHRSFVRSLRESETRVIVCASSMRERDVLEAVGSGAVGYLCKDTLTPEALIGGLRGAASGAGVLDPGLLGGLLRAVSEVSAQILEPRGLTVARLTDREQTVLRLVSEGHPVSEVAQRLSFSERTIKSVLHDILTKMNARTRSEAVATAVREGLI